jgi:hypothetical protein
MATTLTDVRVDLARIEGKVDTFIEQMKKQDDRATDLEVRTRRNENLIYWASGASTIAGVFIEWIFSGHHWPFA